MNISELAYSVHSNSPEKISSERTSVLTKSGPKLSESDRSVSDFSNVLSEFLNMNSDTSSMINSLESSAMTDSLSEALSNTLSAQDLSRDTLEQLQDLAESLTSGAMDRDDKAPDVMSILTDAEKAKEYLSSQSGRQVLARMAENQIAGIVTGNS